MKSINILVLSCGVISAQLHATLIIPRCTDLSNQQKLVLGYLCFQVFPSGKEGYETIKCNAIRKNLSATIGIANTFQVPHLVINPDRPVQVEKFIINPATSSLHMRMVGFDTGLAFSLDNLDGLMQGAKDILDTKGPAVFDKSFLTLNQQNEMVEHEGH